MCFCTPFVVVWKACCHGCLSLFAPKCECRTRFPTFSNGRPHEMEDNFFLEDFCNVALVAKRNQENLPEKKMKVSARVNLTYQKRPLLAVAFDIG